MLCGLISGFSLPTVCASDLLAEVIDDTLGATQSLDYCSAEFRRLLIFAAAKARRETEQKAYADDLNAWLELIDLLEQRPCAAADLHQRARTLLRRFPKHPALRLFPGLFGILEQQPKMAFLLPVKGRFSAFSEALRQGADKALEQTGLSFSFYDTAEQSLAAAYREAVAGGANCVIGPLQKDNVQRMAALDPQMPVLALNYLEEGERAPIGMFQMGLAPEDQALALVDLLEEAELESGVILSVDGVSWSERTLRLFQEIWQSHGGEILQIVRYREGVTDFSLPIKQLLSLDASEERQQRLARVLQRDIAFTPRRRGDVEFILLLADFHHARMLYPQLRFWRVGALPVYASAHVLPPLGQPPETDLDGLRLVLPAWLQDKWQSSSRHYDPAGYFLGYSAAQLAARYVCLRSHDFVHGLSDPGSAWAFDPHTQRFRYRSTAAVIRNGRIHPFVRER